MFSFKSDEINTLRGYLHNALRGPNNELEIRFSTFVKQDMFLEKVQADPLQKPQKFHFVPVIEKTVFGKTLKQFETYGLATEHSVSKDFLYNNYIRNTRLLNENGQVVANTWMTKTKSKYTDIWDINLRICLSSETPCAAIISGELPTMIRHKKRTSFTDKCVRYDFTVVTTENPQSHEKKTSYEIEIEFIPPLETGVAVNKVNDMANHLAYCATHMLRVLGDSPSIITLSEKHNTLLEYSVLSGCFHLPKPRFVGAQPETLHKHHIGKIQSNAYAVSEKYDGESRFHLFISDSGESYLINRSMRVKSSGLLNTADKGTILDVEYAGGALFAFDILFYKGLDLRASAHHHLKKRVQMYNSVVANFLQENCTNENCIPIFAKEYFFENFENVFSRWENNSYTDNIARDGFIFTPVNEPYPNKPKWMNLLKWKPAELNSIDFLVQIAGNNDKKWNLFVGDKDTRYVSFDPCPLITVQDDNLLSVLNGTSPHNKIIECVWSTEGTTFVPWRWREDKNTPNYKTVALDVWNSIQNPVSLSELQTSPFQTMRKYHNLIKSDIIGKSIDFTRSSAHEEAKITVSTNWADDDIGYDDLSGEVRKNEIAVLDLACGRGGDLWKWSAHSSNENPIRYVGVDISDTLLSEAKSRSVEVEKSFPNFTSSFTKADLRSSTPTINTSSKFNIVSCQFALHYFFESSGTFETFLSTVKQYVQENGIFVTSMFDGLSVYEMCCRGYNKQNSNGNGFEIQPKFDIRLGLSNIKGKEFNIPVSAVLSGDDDVILKEATVEYLVFADLFIKRMIDNGFRLIECHRFPDSSVKSPTPLSETEQFYSQLHRYYIFKYEPNRICKFQTIWNDYPFELHECLNLGDSTEKTLYLRKCAFIEELCLIKRHCLLRNLELITGKTLPFKEMSDEGLSFESIAEHFNIFIQIIPLQDNRPVYQNRQLFKPETFLEDVKMVNCLENDHHFFLLARICPETGKKLMTFTPPVSEEVTMDVDDISQSGSGSCDASQDASKVESLPMDIDKMIGDIQTKLATFEQVAENQKSVVEPIVVSKEVSKEDVSLKPIATLSIALPPFQLETSTVKDLQLYAKSINLKVPSAIRKKQDIIDYIKGSQGSQGSQTVATTIDNEFNVEI